MLIQLFSSISVNSGFQNIHLQASHVGEYSSTIHLDFRNKLLIITSKRTLSGIIRFHSCENCSCLQLFLTTIGTTVESFNSFGRCQFINLYLLLTISIQNKMYDCENKGTDYT